MDTLDVRFPAGRRVVLFPTGTAGSISASGLHFVDVEFDDGLRRIFPADWFVKMPAGLRLVGWPAAVKALADE